MTSHETKIIDEAVFSFLIYILFSYSVVRYILFVSQRERKRERERVSVCIIYIYIYSIYRRDHENTTRSGRQRRARGLVNHEKT